MANPQKTPPQPAQTPAQPAPAAPRGPGRPPKDKATTPLAAAIANLQFATDTVTRYIADGNTSLAKRSAQAARAGVPRAVLDKAFAAIKSTITDAEAAVARAYEAPAPKAQAPKSRVNLAAE
ncbi:MAG: hypothetical protein ACYC0F_18040 [Rhodanobacter sp.]